MGLFGIAIGKKATARKAEQKLAKITARQAGKTARVELRQDAKVQKATVKSASDSVAYANGVVPADPLASITGLVGGGLSAVSSFFGGGSGQLADSGGLDSSQGGQGYNSPRNSSSLDVMASSLGASSVSPALLVGGAILLLMLLKKK